MSAAFLTATHAVLPGSPVSNDRIEDVLGRIGGESSRLRARILKNNGIRTRHYAIDPVTGAPTHTSASLAAEAARGVLTATGLGLSDIDLLSCGTSIPEQVTPGIASLVHGELGGAPVEIASTHGVCCAGITALKYAALAVSGGAAGRALAVAVERTSSLLRAEHFAPELLARSVDEKDPYVGFDQEFLRWMLSDGAGAVLVEPTPRPGALNLRIHWIELLSFAHALPTCMYMGAERTPDGGLRGWRDVGLSGAVAGGLFNLHQDVKLLENIVPTCAAALERVRARRPIDAADIDWFLPHYSSELFRAPTYEALQRAKFPIPWDKWASNLVERGNTGAASILVMLDDLLRTGRVRPGHRLLLMVPESGRFSCAFALLEAVA